MLVLSFSFRPLLLPLALALPVDRLSEVWKHNSLARPDPKAIVAFALVWLAWIAVFHYPLVHHRLWQLRQMATIWRKTLPLRRVLALWVVLVPVPVVDWMVEAVVALTAQMVVAAVSYPLSVTLVALRTRLLAAVDDVASVHAAVV